VFILNVEQPGSLWFEIAWKYGRLCLGVFHISMKSIQEFRRRGILAVHAPLGYARTLEAQGAQAPANRPIDILFLGHSSRRRDEFFARHADFFAARQCHIVLADPTKPRRAETAGYYSAEARATLLGSSKILINLHSSERRYFETHRALLALSNRCLLVSEESRQTAPLVSGLHFVASPLDEIPGTCARYLDDPDALTSIAQEGYRFATTQLNVRDTCRVLIERCASTTNRSHSSRDGSPPTDGEDAERQRDAVRGRLADAMRIRAAGNPDWTTESSTAYQSTTPAVSVVITVYNYATFVDECLHSVMSADPVPGGAEVVVVDDASTDDSVAVVQQAVRDDVLPLLLVKKDRNTGLADARNLGVQQARGRFVFMLDADNRIHPSALRRLHSALVDGTSVAAYGLIQRFDGETGEPLGLTSMYDWDVGALIRRPYIDAMAMFDRRRLLEVRGYSTELIEYGWFGWEDYDLWLKLAQAGYRCTLVPNILSAYRVHPHSMIHRTNRSAEDLARYFHQKFRDLVGRFPGMDLYFGFPPPGQAAVSDPDGSPGRGAVPEQVLRRLADLENEVAALYASMSWRITSPLRFAYRFLTGRTN